MVAHAVQWVSKGSAGPFLAYVGPNDSKVTLVDLTESEPESPLDLGRGLLKMRSAARGVIVYDGTISRGDGDQYGALIAEVYEFDLGEDSLDVLVPYRPGTESDGFGVYALMIQDQHGDPASDGVLDAFIAGTRSDSEAGEFWRQHQLR
ncbi:hypothetical protein VMT65_22440 [Nocardia sp. CDC153]|uniref:hypothetical protein n=1 Tax=Nocardia sp. CDC153 TaxID=3112167 RepID=UPI002DB85756|nr:hypothetical protein [Nocardia sp. CDC153]MEC3955809.1 hypothetical protein [Nocardia sp. CDC153]